jgi:hypothetical protein
MPRRLQDTLRLLPTVASEEMQRLGVEAGLEFLAQDWKDGSRAVFLDRKPLSKDGNKVGYHCSIGERTELVAVTLDGVKISAWRFLISPPQEEPEAPIQVELVASTWFETLLQRVLDLLGRRTTRLSKAEKARATAEYRRMLKDEPEVWHKPRTQRKAARRLTNFLGLPENAFQTIEDEVVIPEQRRIGLKDKE